MCGFQHLGLLTIVNALFWFLPIGLFTALYPLKFRQSDQFAQCSATHHGTMGLVSVFGWINIVFGIIFLIAGIVYFKQYAKKRYLFSIHLLHCFFSFIFGVIGAVQIHKKIPRECLSHSGHAALMAFYIIFCIMAFAFPVILYILCGEDDYYCHPEAYTITMFMPIAVCLSPVLVIVFPFAVAGGIQRILGKS